MNDKDKMDYKRVSVQTERNFVTHNNENHDNFSVLLIDVPTEQLIIFSSIIFFLHNLKILIILKNFKLKLN